MGIHFKWENICGSVWNLTDSLKNSYLLTYITYVMYLILLCFSGGNWRCLHLHKPMNNHYKRALRGTLPAVPQTASQQDWAGCEQGYGSKSHRPATRQESILRTHPSQVSNTKQCFLQITSTQKRPRKRKPNKKWWKGQKVFAEIRGPKGNSTQKEGQLRGNVKGRKKHHLHWCVTSHWGPSVSPILDKVF